jgi:hypothetical protein
MCEFSPELMVRFPSPVRVHPKVRGQGPQIGADEGRQVKSGIEIVINVRLLSMGLKAEMDWTRTSCVWKTRRRRTFPGMGKQGWQNERAKVQGICHFRMKPAENLMGTNTLSNEKATLFYDSKDLTRWTRSLLSRLRQSRLVGFPAQNSHSISRQRSSPSTRA